MLLTVENLINEFGLEKEFDFIFDNKYCQGEAYVNGSLSGNILNFQFENRTEYFKFLVEAKNLIENNIWEEVGFISMLKPNVSNKNIEWNESLCKKYAMEIDTRTQEILQKYISKNDKSLKREEVLLQNIISNTKECLLNLEQLGKFTNLL